MGYRASSCPPPHRIFVADPTASTPQHAPVGWEPDDDGFRGYVFATDDNSTVVLSVKGTSPRLVGGGGPTAEKDKLNDNCLCDCYRSGWKCNQNCLEDATDQGEPNLYNNITFMFPDANIWVIGHSLGGSLASLLGATFGVPVVTFEPPGERMAAQRLHLPSPPSTHHITHVWHTADPIAMGPYDTVSNLSWSVDVRTHAIAQMIEKVLSQPWAAAVELGREVPPLKRQDDCVDCYKWDFGNYSLL
ncbi:Alpha/Beta hydrolase protein [Russula brevipes]|nr:Alpha/Beta hydrolase protein [Russula brevipes]